MVTRPRSIGAPPAPRNVTRVGRLGETAPSPPAITRAAISRAPRPLNLTIAMAERPSGVARAQMGSESMKKVAGSGERGAGNPTPLIAYRLLLTVLGDGRGGVSGAVRFRRSRSWATIHCCGMLARFITE